MGITSPETIETAIDVGYRHLDTAQLYENEAVVGTGVDGSSIPREELTIATKVWKDSLEPSAVRETTRVSRDRLALDTIDLCYVHRPADTYDPETTLPAFDELVEDGIIDHIGLSNYTLGELETAREILDQPIAAHQVEYHPLYQPEALLEDAQTHGYPLVAYSPLSNGRIDSIPELAEIAEKYETTPATVAIAWLCTKENLVPIPKASSREHLEANLAAADLELDVEDVERIDSIEREHEVFPE